MLIEFTTGNFRSIKDPVTLSMVAAKLVSRDKVLDEENVARIDNDLSLLKSAAIYGANAGGKTNICLATEFMRLFVLNSSRETQLDDRIGVESFRLSTETADKPSFFEMVFLLEGTKYRYGFEATPQRVTAEWLFLATTSREAKLFERENDRIKVTDRFKEGKGLEDRTRANALFLSVAAQFNGVVSGKILDWFRQFRINLGVEDQRELAEATERFHRAPDKEAVLKFVKDLDLGISDIQSEEKITPRALDSFNGLSMDEVLRIYRAGQFSTRETKIATTHQKYDELGHAAGVEQFDLYAHESAGTRRLFSLALPIMEALEDGHVLLIDEIDARLHPLITLAITSMFNSKRGNPKNAQLIFATHDANLLSNKRFRRDQVWFAEKDRFGATHLYSLAEFKVRNDASFRQDYIRGRYGAIPFITGDPALTSGVEHAGR